MNSIKVLRVVLILILASLLAALLPRGPGTYAPPVPARAQGSSGNPEPPLSGQNVPQAGEEEQESPKGRTSISVSVDLVTLQALVTDSNGGVILGLRPENFTVYEDNVKQEIASFAPVDADITVVMLVEYSNNVEYFLEDVWNAMYTFASTLRPGDWVAVVAYDMHTTILCDFTRDRQKLSDTLRRFMYPAWNESNLSDALIETLDRTQELEGKVAVLLISTGLDTFSKHTYEEALQKCKEANASVYAIGLGQRFRIYAESAGLIGSIGNLELLMADNRLKYFTEYTGGAAYFPRFQTELPTIFGNISQLLRSQYSISYASTNTKKDGKFRKIKVEVKADVLDKKGKPAKLKVTTRKGYVARES